MKINRILLALLGLIATGIVIGAIFYPEDFALTLVGLMLGLFLGITLATVLMESYFQQGASMAYELQKKQLVNPGQILREFRLTERDEQKRAQAQEPKASKQEAIPQFEITGI